jgi:hypothetical protein
MALQRSQLNLVHQPAAMHESIVADAQALIQVGSFRCFLTHRPSPAMAGWPDALAGSSEALSTV